MITTNTTGAPLSAGFISAVGQGIIDYDVKLFSEGTDTGWGIQWLELQLGAGAEAWDDLADFHPGEVYSSQMEAKLYDVTGTVIGTELEVRVGVWTGSAYEYVTVAWMTIVKASEWKGITTVKARGRIASKLSVSAGLADGSMTPSALAAAISTACGVTVTVGTFTNLPDVDVDASMTCREALSALAKRLGGYGAETPDGGVQVASYGSSGAYALPEDFVTYAPDFTEGTYTVSGLTVESATGVWEFGDGRVHLEDQKATQATATMTWGNLQGYSYQPGNIEVALIDPRVTVFDTVSTSVDGTARSLPARGITITYDGGYFGTYSASGIPLEEEKSLIEGPLTERLSSAQQAAEEAAAIAEAVDQHFWYNTQGAHVTEQIQSDFLEAQADGFPGISDQNPYYNAMWNTNGMLLRSGDTNLAAFTRSATAFYDGQGNNAGNIMARFGSDGVALYDGQGSQTANVVAKFTEDEIALGVNHDSATIDLVNGTGTISKGSYGALEVLGSQGVHIGLDAGGMAGSNDATVIDGGSGTQAAAIIVGNPMQLTEGHRVEVDANHFVVQSWDRATLGTSPYNVFMVLSNGQLYHLGGTDMGQTLDFHTTDVSSSAASINTAFTQDYVARIRPSNTGGNLGIYLNEVGTTNVIHFLLGNGGGRMTYRTSSDGGTTWSAQKGLRSPWVSLGSFTGSAYLNIDLTDYEEVMVVAKFSSKLFVGQITKLALTTTFQEWWLSGGKDNTSPSTGGAARALVNVRTTRVQGVAANNGSSDVLSSTTFTVYAR